MKQLRGVFLLLATAMGSLLPLAAQADVWGYVDENGMTHFAEKKLDARYQLYFKTESFKFDPRKATVMATGRGARTRGVGAAGLVYNPKADSAAGTKAQRLVALSLTSAVGLLTYLVAARILRLREVASAVALVRRRVGR